MIAVQPAQRLEEQENKANPVLIKLSSDIHCMTLQMRTRIILVIWLKFSVGSMDEEVHRGGLGDLGLLKLCAPFWLT